MIRIKFIVPSANRLVKAEYTFYALPLKNEIAVYI